MKRRIEEIRKRLAEQRRLWRHNHTQHRWERFGMKMGLMISNMPATH